MSGQHDSVEKITEIPTDRLDILIRHVTATHSIGHYQLKAKGFGLDLTVCIQVSEPPRRRTNRGSSGSPGTRRG
jgi:hypothetical protein